MLVINIDKQLKKNNRSRYWLAKKINMTYQNLCKLANNETSSIQFNHLEKICTALNCTPSDIITIKAE